MGYGPLVPPLTTPVAAVQSVADRNILHVPAWNRMETKP